MLRYAEVPGENFLWWLDLLATTLSFFGSLWMIIHCFKAPSPKSLSLKLIAAIGLADFLYSVSNLLSNFEIEDSLEVVEDFDLCELEAILRQVSYVLSIFFSTCVAVASYFSASPGRRFNKTLFFTLSIIIGLLISFAYIKLIPELFEPDMVISQGPLYCWFSYSPLQMDMPEHDKLLISIVFQALPVMVGLIISLIAYLLAIKKLQEISQGFLDESKITLYRVLWYPGVLFLTFVPNVTMIIYIIYEEPPVWMTALHLYLPHSIGFNNALLYGIQTKLYRTNYEEQENKAIELDDDSKLLEYQLSLQDRDSLKDSLKEAFSC